MVANSKWYKSNFQRWRGRNMMNIQAIREENNRVCKNLNKENQQIYTDIVCYLRVSNLSDLEQEEVFGDVLRMFFDCQNKGKEVKNIIGEDYKQFTDDIIMALNPRKSLMKKVKEYLLIFLEALCYVFTIDFILLYLPQIVKGNLSLSYNYSLDMAARSLLIFVAVLYLFNYVGRNSFKLSKRRIPKNVRLAIGCSVGCFIAILFFLSETLNEVILLSIDIRIIIAIIAVFLFYKMTQRFVLHKQLSKLNS